jgi:hypothetical protein
MSAPVTATAFARQDRQRELPACLAAIIAIPAIQPGIAS